LFTDDHILLAQMEDNKQIAVQQLYDVFHDYADDMVNKLHTFQHMFSTNRKLK